MSQTTSVARLPLTDPSNLHINERRRASWLKSLYTDPVWLVADTYDDSEPRIIDFRYRLADGRLLTENERLYATVKEYAWFVRDGRFSKIDTAQAHLAAVSQQCAIAHALTRRGIASYAHLQKGDIEALVQEMRYGTDAVLHASERAVQHIAAIEARPEIANVPYRGFPVARNAQGHSKNMIDSAQLVAACNLPDRAKSLPRVSWLIATAALRNGMTPMTKQPAKDMPALNNVTKQQLQRWLDSLDLLFTFRNYAECEIPGFRPFPDGVMKIANQHGVDSKPTPVPPARLTLHLLEASAKWVANYSKPILACLQDLKDETSDGWTDVSSVVGRYREDLPNRIISMSDGDHGNDDEFIIDAVEMLFTACWVIVAAFTARRYKETMKLNEASLAGSDEEGWWLNCFISKTTREREWIPVPLIVARAFQILVTLSADARSDDADGVFAWEPPPVIRRGGGRMLSPRKLLNSFAALVGTPPHDDGKAISPWRWIPRQFRRFYAVLYFYRFDGADLAVLSYFLRHFDIETTRGYVTRDPEAAKIWHEVEKDYVRRLADSIASGEREVGGAMGERLKKLTKLIKERLRKHLFVSGETVGETLHKIMERGGLVITPKAWTTCTCPRTNNAAKKARCRAGQFITEEIVGPSYADAGPTVCEDCRWALKEPTKDQYASQIGIGLEEAVASDCGRGTLFRELQQNQLVDIRRVTGPSSGVSPTRPEVKGAQ